MTMWQYHNTTTQQDDNTIWLNDMTIQKYHNTTIQQYDNTTCVVISIWQHDNSIAQYNNTTIWQYNNIPIQQHNNMTIQHDRTIWQYHNITIQQHNNMIIQHASSYQYATIRTYIHLHQKIYDKLENLNEVLKIDNIRSASDHGMNHICKLIIESEMLVVFARWTQEEFRQMSTTCNYLEDGIWIADVLRVLESSISMAVTISRMYVALSGLGKISIK